MFSFNIARSVFSRLPPSLPPSLPQIVMGLGPGTLGVTRAWVAEQTKRHTLTFPPSLPPSLPISLRVIRALTPPSLPPSLPQIVMGLGSGTLGVTRAWVAEQTERHKR